MSVTGNEGGPISLDDAVKWINNFKAKTAPGEVTAHLFGKNIINNVLNQAGGCMGIRIYYGLNDQGAKQLIIFGVDANDNTLTAYIADLSFPCPPTCPRFP